MKINNKNKINDKNNNNKNNDKTHSVNDDYYHKPTPYRSIFLSRWFESVPKQRRRGTAGKKLVQQKKSYLFSTKGIQPNKELH